jgi:elongation factor P
MATTADFRNGMVLEIKGELWSIIEFLHVKPGKGGAFVRTKLKKVPDGAVVDKTFRAGERINEVRLERRKLQYLYQSEDLYYLMDSETFDQYVLDETILGDQVGFLKEGSDCEGLIHNGGVIGVELPYFIDLKVVETDPGVRGDTTQGGTKPAKLETGIIVQVPLFISKGEVIRIDRRNSTYLERVN